MVGNIYEWTEDCVHTGYKGAPKNDSAWLGDNGGDCTARVVRGGSWMDDPDLVGSEWRAGYSTNTRDWAFGLRVARTLAAGAGRLMDVR